MIYHSNGDEIVVDNGNDYVENNGGDAHDGGYDYSSNDNDFGGDIDSGYEYQLVLISGPSECVDSWSSWDSVWIWTIRVWCSAAAGLPSLPSRVSLFV